jgi:hypothetical protein
MLNKISNDNSEVLQAEAQENGTHYLTFNVVAPNEFSPSATVKVGYNYTDSPVKTYGVGTGITLSVGNTQATLEYKPADWGNINAVGDASLLVPSVATNVRDFKIKFTVNPSFQ